MRAPKLSDFTVCGLYTLVDLLEPHRLCWSALTVDRRVFLHHVVPDLGRRHGPSHRWRRLGHGVAPEVHHTGVGGSPRPRKAGLPGIMVLSDAAASLRNRFPRISGRDYTAIEIQKGHQSPAGSPGSCYNHDQCLRNISPSLLINNHRSGGTEERSVSTNPPWSHFRCSGIF